MTKYEEYQLMWMIEHGHSLQSLIQELEEVQFSDPEDSNQFSAPVSELFAQWEQDVGFGSEIWACEAEWKEVEGSEEIQAQAMDNVFRAIGEHLFLAIFNTSHGPEKFIIVASSLQEALEKAAEYNPSSIVTHIQSTEDAHLYKI